MSVEPFAVARKMTLEQYRRERAELRQTYGDSIREAGAKADQALAGLFYRSEWTQQELATEEKKSQSWAERRLRFGRFLAFTPTGVNPENASFNVAIITERHFRKYWDRTDPTERNERRRFGLVLRLMADELTLSRTKKHKTAIGEAIKGTCGNGEWHRLTTIVTKVQSVEESATLEDVRAVLAGMVQHGWYNVFAEKKKGGDTYRILKGGDTKIDLDTLQHELGPLIAGLKTEGRKNMATMSPGTVMNLACKIEKALARLAHGAPDRGAETED